MAFLDLTGSGIETVAHLRQNGRIVVMFCSFACPPGTPSVIHVQVNRVADACGYGVPTMDYVAERSQPLRWAEQPREAGLAEGQARSNAASIDGLPRLDGDR